jgi:hypothetical protein
MGAVLLLFPPYAKGLSKIALLDKLMEALVEYKKAPAKSDRSLS